MKKTISKIGIIFLTLIFCLSFVACDKNDLSDKPNEAVLTDESIQNDNSEFNSALFDESSLIYNNDLAIICAELSEAAEDTKQDKIIAKYQSLGINNTEAYEYTNGIKILGVEVGFQGGAFAIGSKEINIGDTTSHVLVITARGSTTAGEFLGDIFKGWEGQKTDLFLDKYYVYDNIFDFYLKIEAGLESYLDNHLEIKNDDNLKVLITGHSLGGAAANMLGAGFNAQHISEKYGLNKLNKSNIYVYTFGAIKTISNYNNIEEGYENIHNVFNYYDSFAENGMAGNLEASSYHYKFGHTEMYYIKAENDRGILNPTNHLNYVEALTTEKDNPGTVITLACAEEKAIEPTEEINPVPVVPDTSTADFTIQGSWKSIGTYGFGQAQPGATVTFNETNCNFYSPYDTYQFYQENGKWRLSCKNVLWQDVQYFTVTILDIDNIEIVYDGSNQKTVLQRIPY